MRQALSILLLFSIGIKPAIELAPYIYYEANIDYIITNYCINKEDPVMECNGKCYLKLMLLEQQLLSNALENNSGQQDYVPVHHFDFKALFSLVFFDTLSNNHFAERSGIVVKHLTPYFANYHYLFIQSVVKPPWRFA